MEPNADLRAHHARLYTALEGAYDDKLNAEALVATRKIDSEGKRSWRDLISDQAGLTNYWGWWALAAVIELPGALMAATGDADPGIEIVLTVGFTVTGVVAGHIIGLIRRESKHAGASPKSEPAYRIVIAAAIAFALVIGAARSSFTNLTASSPWLAPAAALSTALALIIGYWGALRHESAEYRVRRIAHEESVEAHADAETNARHVTDQYNRARAAYKVFCRTHGIAELWTPERTVSNAQPPADTTDITRKNEPPDGEEAA